MIILFFVCQGCLKTTTEIPVTMSLSTDSLIFSSSGGQKSFIVESNVSKWTVSCNVSSWLTFSPDSGSRKGSVTVTVTPNTGTSSKSAVITVSGTGVTNQKIDVAIGSAAPTLSLSPSSLIFAASGEAKSFTVTSNISWALISRNDGGQSWLTLSRSAGSNSDSIGVTTVSLTANANTGLSPREAKIAAYGNGVDTAYLAVTQAAVTNLSVSTSALNFSSDSERKDFTIASNASWTVASNQFWCTVQPGAGAGNGTITVSVTENTTTTSRQAMLTVTSGNLSERITINQEGSGATGGSTEFGNDIQAAGGFGGGDGTLGAPYLIYNAQQLKRWVDNYNFYRNSCFMLMSNIQVSANEWRPINDFAGNFDGGGHTISGTLKSNRDNFFGFFASLANGARVSNLKITATIINEGAFTSSSEPFAYTGAIAGISANATISNCDITGSVTGGMASIKYTGGVLGAGSENDVIQDCMVSGKISGGKATGANGLSSTGGIAGRALGVIINCTVSSSAQISGGENDASSHTGGIAGQNNSRIANCTNHAPVTGGLYVGGLVGSNDGVIHTSLNNGNLSGIIAFTGGLAGSNNNYTNVHIYDCCSNSGFVCGSTAHPNNQIGTGKGVEPCPDKHTKR